MEQIKTIALEQNKINELKQGKVIETALGYVSLINKVPHLMKKEQGSKAFTNVYLPRPQGQGKTTLSLNEAIALNQAALENRTYVIYRGEVRDDNGELIKKDINDIAYTSKAIKIELKGVLNEFNELVDVIIVNQTSNIKLEPKEVIKVSLLQEVTF